MGGKNPRIESVKIRRDRKGNLLASQANNSLRFIIYFRLEVCSVFGATVGPRNVELDLTSICWVLGSKTTYSPGDSACRSSIRDLALCKSRAASNHRKFTSSIFCRMSREGSM